MYCEHCGTYLEESDKYCPKCGSHNPDYKKQKKHEVVSEVHETTSVSEVAAKPAKKNKALVYIVCASIVVIITFLLVGFLIDVKHTESFSIYLHEQVVENSEKAKALTAHETRYTTDHHGNVNIEESVYAYDLNAGKYYHQRIVMSQNKSQIYIEFDAIDESKGKYYEYSNYSDLSVNQLSRYKISVVGKTSMPDTSWNNPYTYVNRAKSALSAPGKGCSNICTGKTFLGDLKFEFNDDYNDEVITKNHKIVSVSWFGDSYTYEYKYVDSEYFTLY